MKKRINLVINGKGGVGKSFFATNFVQYLKDCGAAHCAIDSDHENSTLKRFHPEAEFINLEHHREIDRVFTTAETHDMLVIDCRAASTDLFIDFFDEVGLTEVLRSLGADLTVICPVNHEADSVEQLRILSDALRDSCGGVVVKNEAHSDTFKIYDASRTRRQVVKVLHARKIAMPRMYDWLVTALNEYNTAVTSALTNPALTCSSAATEGVANALLPPALSCRRPASERCAFRREVRRVSTDDPLAHAISEWQRKHRIADDDPILAVLRLVRLQLQHAHTDRDSAMQRRRVSKTSGARLRCSTDADAAPATLILRHTYNLTSDRTIPYSTFAKAVVDTTSSLGQSGDKGFFKNQAQIHIAAALETLREIGADVTLENAYSLLLDQGDLDEAKSDLASSHQTTCRRELTEHFANRFLSQPPEQIGGVRLTHREWIDLVVGVLIGAYIVKEAVEILHDARTASREQV